MTSAVVFQIGEVAMKLGKKVAGSALLLLSLSTISACATVPKANCSEATAYRELWQEVEKELEECINYHNDCD